MDGGVAGAGRRTWRWPAPTPTEALAGAGALVVLVAVPLVGTLLETAWPAVIAAVACAVPAVVPLRRAALWTLLASLVASVALGLAAVGDPAPVPWLVAATLAAAVLGLLGRHRHVVHRRRLDEVQARQEAVSVRDDLTGCSNQAGLLLFGDHVLQGVRRRGEAMYALVVDVDGLARVNERLGRDAGDEVLVAVADALRSSTRGTDVVARGSQDDFAVVGPGAGVSPGELERRVRAHLVEAPPTPLDVWPCRVTAGLAVLEPWDGGDVTDLLRKAHEDLSLRSSLRAPSAPEPIHDPRTRP